MSDDTPRTDAQFEPNRINCALTITGQRYDMVSAIFARQLERELSAANAEVQRLSDTIGSFRDDLRKENKQLHAKLAAYQNAVVVPESVVKYMERLLMAVKTSEFHGVICYDVDGENWFDARRETLAALAQLEKESHDKDAVEKLKEEK